MLNSELVDEELDKILHSDYFRSAERRREVLEYLVKKTREGVTVKEMDIALDVYKDQNYDPAQDTYVRKMVKEIRSHLALYYKEVDPKSPSRIEIPKGRYSVEFKKMLPPLPPPIPPRPAVQGRSNWKRIFVVVAVVVAAGVAAWLFYNRACDPAISIVSPKPEESVHRFTSVVAKRDHIQWFCRCRDYVAVEPVGYSEIWIQGLLPSGAQSHLTARFGTSDTDPGTRFSIFILTSKSELKPQPIPESSPLVADAVESSAVEVVLERQ